MFYFWVQCVHFGFQGTKKTGWVNADINVFRDDAIKWFLLKHIVNVDGTENALR